MKKQLLSLNTDGAGAALVLGSAIFGRLYAIEYRPGTIVTGATLTVTCESNSSKPLLTKVGAGIVNSWYYPRDIVHAVLDGGVLTGTAGGDRGQPILQGVPKVVIASGGATKAGSLIIYYEE